MPPTYDEIARYCGTTVVRVADLFDAGMARSTVAHRCRPDGPWQRLMPGVVLLHNGPVTRTERRLAALLHGGPGAVLTGLDALALFGMERMPSPFGAVHVLIPAERRRGGAGRVLVERTERLPAPAPGRWPLAPIPRAAVDAARRLTSITEVRATLAEVVQRGRCEPTDLIREVVDGSMRGSALARAVLAEVADGVRSAAEARARELVHRSGLPAPMWNAELYDGAGRLLLIPDAWFDDVGLAWEIDSVGWHLSPADYARTMQRRSVMSMHSIRTVHTQPRTLQEAPKEVLRELVIAYDDAARLGRPLVTARERAAHSSNLLG